jgi:hypothetical protein
VRAASDARLDAADHIMTYFFADTAELGGFSDLAVALREAGRMPYLLPSVQRGAYAVQDKIAARRARVGADVLPWWPARGVYLLVEMGAFTPITLPDVPGIAGLWRGSSVADPSANVEAGQQITYFFLDGDPVETGERLQSWLKRRWEGPGIQPLLAAPFFTVVPYEWDRHLP